MNKKHTWNPDQLHDGRECIGEITDAEWKEGEYGEQLHVQIKPLDYEPQGETGREHEWYSYSTRTNSKWGTLIRALKGDCGLEMKSEKDLIGKTFRWERRILKFGDMETKETWLPTEFIKGSGKDEHDFSELNELLKDGISKKKIVKWGRKHGIPKKTVIEYLEGLFLAEEDGELFLEE